VSTKASAKTTDVVIDTDGTQAGMFNAAGTPVLSYVRWWTATDDGVPKRQPDQWILTYPTPAGSQSFHTGVLNRNDPAGAEAKAQEHLRDISYTPKSAKLEQFGNEPESNGW